MGVVLERKVYGWKAKRWKLVCKCVVASRVAPRRAAFQSLVLLEDAGVDRARVRAAGNFQAV